jgi:hypothetical protein
MLLVPGCCPASMTLADVVRCMEYSVEGFVRSVTTTL